MKHEGRGKNLPQRREAAAYNRARSRMAMGNLGDGLFDPSYGDWQARLDAVVDTMRRMSRQEDPEEALRTYAGPMRRLMHFDRTISLTRQGLDRPRFRIRRSDLMKSDVVGWKDAAKLPVLE